MLLFLPRALVNIRSGLAQAPKELDEAAQALGKPPLLAFLRVTLRLTAPAAAGGAALVFLAIVNELTAACCSPPTAPGRSPPSSGARAAKSTTPAPRPMPC